MAGQIQQEKKTDTPPKQARRRDGETELLRFLLKLCAAAIIGWAILTFVLGIYVVHGNDMYPALRDGDLCITWRLSEPGYGDIVAYDCDGVRRFGRVVGMPGDVIDIDDSGSYTLNGGVPDETVYYETRKDPEITQFYPSTVGDQGVFLMNDYRDSTADSRRFGTIPLTFTDGSVAILLRRRSW